MILAVRILILLRRANRSMEIWDFHVFPQSGKSDKSVWLPKAQPLAKTQWERVRSPRCIAVELMETSQTVAMLVQPCQGTSLHYYIASLHYYTASRFCFGWSKDIFLPKLILSYHRQKWDFGVSFPKILKRQYIHIKDVWMNSVFPLILILPALAYVAFEMFYFCCLFCRHTS